MSGLTKHPTEENLIESWVEVSDISLSPVRSPAPDRGTPSLPYLSNTVPSQEYLRLLREAQRESNASSARVSLASTRKNSPHSSPKSPPNSPNNEPATGGEELKGVYINYFAKEGLAPVESHTDWVWDWSSRPDQQPPKDWKFNHPAQGQSGVKRKTYYSMRSSKIGNNGLFSKEVMYTVVITNLLSLILGAGIGVWLSRRQMTIVH